MAIYSVDVKRTEYGHVFVEADSPEEAVELAKYGDIDEDGIVVEFNTDYDWEFDDSWEEGVRLAKEDED